MGREPRLALIALNARRRPGAFQRPGVLASPEDIMHMRAGDVSSLPVEQPLIYVGHLKFTALAMPLPGLWIPVLLPSSGEARGPGR